jgi:hypothetical protein
LKEPFAFDVARAHQQWIYSGFFWYLLICELLSLLASTGMDGFFRAIQKLITLPSEHFSPFHFSLIQNPHQKFEKSPPIPNSLLQK